MPYKIGLPCEPQLALNERKTAVRFAYRAPRALTLVRAPLQACHAQSIIRFVETDAPTSRACAESGSLGRSDILGHSTAIRRRNDRSESRPAPCGNWEWSRNPIFCDQGVHKSDGRGSHSATLRSTNFPANLKISPQDVDSLILTVVRRSIFRRNKGEFRDIRLSGWGTQIAYRNATARVIPITAGFLDRRYWIAVTR